MTKSHELPKPIKPNAGNASGPKSGEDAQRRPIKWTLRRASGAELQFWSGKDYWRVCEAAHLLLGYRPAAYPLEFQPKVFSKKPPTPEAQPEHWKVWELYGRTKDALDSGLPCVPYREIPLYKVRPYDVVERAKQWAQRPGMQWLELPPEVASIEAPKAEPIAQATPAVSATTPAIIPPMTGGQLARYFRYPFRDTALDEPAPGGDPDSVTPENRRMWKQAGSEPHKYWRLDSARAGKPKAGAANKFHPDLVAKAIIAHDDGEELQVAKGMLAIIAAQPHPERFADLASYWRKRSGDE